MSKVLLADDDYFVLQLYKVKLRDLGYEVVVASTIEEAIKLLDKHDFDLIVLDLFFGQESCLKYIADFHQGAAYVTKVILSGLANIESIVEAFQRGVTFFLEKQSGPDSVVKKIKEIIDNDNPTSNHQVGSEHEIIGGSPEIVSILTKVKTIAKFKSKILVTGESGTGKEKIVRMIHRLSPFSDGPFFAINCGAIPENLLESELFGYKKGAFTDAKKDQKGLFERASGGTLFLDEVGDLPMSMQVKLLRVLQENEVCPLGSQTAVPVSARIIAATNKDLAQVVKEGLFRADLFFRLNVVNIHLPALRERPDDIIPLFNFFLEKLSKKYGVAVKPVSQAIRVRLASYPWPGNIRELENAVERSIVLGSGELHIKDLINSPMSELAGDDLSQDSSSIPPFKEAKSRFEKEYLIQLLKDSNGNIALASRISGQHRANLYRLYKRNNIDIEHPICE